MHSTPASAAPLPPPPVSYSYDQTSDEASDSYDQTSDEASDSYDQTSDEGTISYDQTSDEGTRGEPPSLCPAAALGLGAADGSAQLPNMDESLSALLAREGAAATHPY